MAETVRRQVGRGAGRTTAAQAEAKIRERFALDASLPARKVATMDSPKAVAAEIAVLVGASGGPRHTEVQTDGGGGDNAARPPVGVPDSAWASLTAQLRR